MILTKRLNSTSGIYLYCNTITFTAPQISAFFCNYLSTYDSFTAETSFAGQVGHSFTPTVAHFATTTAQPSSTSGGIKASSASSTATATSVTASGGGQKKNVNKKAIIGGTIGGVLGAALIAVLVILFLRWRNTPEEPEAAKGPSASLSDAVAAKPEEIGSGSKAAPELP